MRAIRGGETILVHGDYDVDGMCVDDAAHARRSVPWAAKVVPFIPRRLADGYDLTEAGVRAAREAGATRRRHLRLRDQRRRARRGRCRARGSTSSSPITTSRAAPLPECLAVLNPKRPGCGSEDKDLAAVGVAFKLALAVTRALGGNENVVFGMLDLVALATIADVAPLRGENRVFARYGLRMLGETKNLGLRALIRAAGLEGKPLTAGRVGFILAPRLNAVGRLGHALRGVELLHGAERARGERHRARARGAQRQPPGDRSRHAGAGAPPGASRSISTTRSASCSPRRAGIPA